MKYLSLDGDWELVERPLADGVSSYASVATAPASFAARVPGDVNDDIFRSGHLPEPLTALNFRRYSSWVPERSWWYRRTFVVEESTEPFVELALDGLDVHADVWLNGKRLGHHATAFYPFVAEVTDVIKRGAPNLLVVRVTTGREHVKDITPKKWPLLGAVPTEAGRGYPDRGFPQRVFLRKPAFTWGWDWSPALPTCGITGNCGLRFFGVNRIEHVRMATLAVRHYKYATIGATVDIQRRSVTSTAWGKVVLRMTCEDGFEDVVSADDVLIRSGLTRVEVRMDIKQPRLWWPNGAGEQHRYKVELTLECDGETIAHPVFCWGIRTVAMDVRPGVFRFIVNGHAMFMQGANWIPCDHLYGRTTPARLTQLVHEAAEANFNCLRVWGGGRYELDAFFDACDEKGILVWHDFMSACAPLPYEDPKFAELCRREAVFQMRRLHNRACMLLWCGNNEVGACYEWFKELFAKHRDPAWPLYFEDLPRIAAAESPVPYWPTSPYGGKDSVTDPRVGDEHHWVVMRPDPKFWSTPEYWDSKNIPVFNSEYGYGGPCCLASTRDYLGTDKPDLSGKIGREHTNTFYNIPRVNHSIKQHYDVDKPDSISQYIRLGGLCQGLNYGYSLESMRAHPHTWGGIFWMFNDAWGENGWTIVDYYLRRKISYYFVKRALAPFRLALRRGSRNFFGGPHGHMMLIVINGTPRMRRGKIYVGYRRYNESEWEPQVVSYCVEAFSRKVLDVGPLPTGRQLQYGTVVAVESMFSCTSTVWRHAPYHKLKLPPAKLSISCKRIDGNDLLFRVKTDCFAHAVHFDVPDDIRMSDCWFDLIPGEARTVRIYNGAKLSQSLRAFCENQ